MIRQPRGVTWPPFRRLEALRLTVTGPPDRRMRRTLMLALFWGYVAVVVAGSVMPLALQTPGGDKAAHASAYGLMVLLRFPLVTERRGLAFGFGLVCAIGASVEIVQSMIPYRTASYGDLAANCLGALLGSAVGLLIRSVGPGVARQR